MSSDSSDPAGAGMRHPELNQSRWIQKRSLKTPREGQRVGTCGHVLGCEGDVAFFDGYLHGDVDGETVDVVWVAVCPDCGERADFDLRKVQIVDYVVVG